MSELRDKTVKGVAWSAMDRFASQGIGFVFSIILASNYLLNNLRSILPKISNNKQYNYAKSTISIYLLLSSQPRIIP